MTEVEHVYYAVPRMDKDCSLVRIIEAENPPSALIFCNTKEHVDYVTVVLQRFGYDADGLSSDLSQEARGKVMDRALLEARLRSRDSLKAERMQRFLPLARGLTEESDEIQLLAMLLDDFYQETFHAPLVPPDLEASRPELRGGSRRHSPPRQDGRSRRPRDSNRRRR